MVVCAVAIVTTHALVSPASGASAGSGVGTAQWVSPGSPSSSPSSSSSPPASPSPSASLSGDACAASIASKLSLPDQAGQVLMIGTPIATPAQLTDTVAKYHLGGVFFQGRSTQSAATLHQSIDSLQSAARSSGAVPLQIALDQEGGEVQTLKGTDFPTIPSAVSQGQLSTSALTSQTTDWATRLVHAGVSLDLAPVADTVPAGTAQDNPPIGELDRQYGSTPDAVARDVSTVVTAAQSAGLLTTLKHFPGLGRVRANTDTSTHAVDDQTTADDPSLDPFASGIQAGTAAVMMSSATYPKLDSQNIAAFSSAIVTGLLRQKLGFKGLIMSDDLGAAVAASAVPVGQRAVRFIEAGGDLVLSVRSQDAEPMADALVAQAQGSGTFAAQLVAAAQQVIASKVRAGLVSC
ncbi:glycoside hydrolase family 3 protein [Rugosimonospora acidiphila]|uniref:Glycoside hydrolase family 3 protein n=1 Tax=Rugosimonospora acidiphila TaxID=556531 RepID=A0ABP9SK22_9ACTN